MLVALVLITRGGIREEEAYFVMNCENVRVYGLNLDGNYGFDGCKNLLVEDSKLLSKDAFWNCENVTVRNSFISGEYLAWNSKNVTFENCVIESLQGLCYVQNLVLRGCQRAFQKNVRQ